MYCSSCGSKLEYFSTKPNFCPSCGTSINGVAPQKQKIVASSRAESEEAETPIEDIPSLKMGVDIVIGGFDKPKTFEQVRLEGAAGMAIPRRTMDNSKPIAQQMLDMCKPVAKPSDIEE